MSAGSQPLEVVDYAGLIPEIPDRDAAFEPDSYIERVAGTDSYRVVSGRRPSTMLLVSKLRREVAVWRAAGWDGASPTTQRLFTWWFHQAEGLSLYWGQREAIETLAYVVEVRKTIDMKELLQAFATAEPTLLLPDGLQHQTTVDGTRQVEREIDGKIERYDLAPPDLGRFAFKMATGTGKTLVMALAVVWSYFNAKRESGSPLSTNFLILAPNVIVFERLRLDFESGRIFSALPLVPPEWTIDLRVILRGEDTEPRSSGNLVVTNIQQLREEDSWTPANAVEALLGRKPTLNAASKAKPILERLRGLDRLVVMNDEAHHVHDEDLVWHKTLLDLHERLPQGLGLWLDFSATPKYQTGAYYPWIICDYPLAQAVEDRIVKAPMILHLVDRPDPGDVKGKEAVEKYRDWIVTGLARLSEHTESYREIAGTKPVMFVMCESITHANKIGEWLKDPSSGSGLTPDQILVIHTGNDGEVKDKDLPALREAARAIDEPNNPVRVVVSVLVLREGWDVRNVTVVLGLRPATSDAKILPEQAVGRGLRLIPRVSPDTRQVLEVLGTPGFESFVRQLEAEGVNVPSVNRPPKPPIIVQPVKERLAYDIVLPKTGPIIKRALRRIDDLDVAALPAIMTAADIARLKALRVEVEAAPSGVTLASITIERRPLISTEIVSAITRKTESLAKLVGQFAILVPHIRRYLIERCFDEQIDLDSEPVRIFLTEPAMQDKVAEFLAQTIGSLAIELQPLELEQKPIKLSATPPFQWRREHTVCERTIFNYVATFNAFETAFAEFLERAEDVARFAALAETFTGFWVEYLKPSGAIGKYYPDWAVIQTTPESTINWIVETKGRVWDGTEQKDAAIDHWCNEVAALTSEPWRYIRVNQIDFEAHQPLSFADIEATSAVSSAET